MPKLPVATNFWRPLPDFETGVEAWIYAGGAHHTAFTYDLTAEQMGDWAAAMGIEAVFIGQGYHHPFAQARPDAGPGVLPLTHARGGGGMPLPRQIAHRQRRRPENEEVFGTGVRLHAHQGRADRRKARPPCLPGTIPGRASFENGVWTYPLEEAWKGLNAAISGVQGLEDVAAVGVSGMMHGYLAFDADWNLLVPFRTWQNTMTAQAGGGADGAVSASTFPSAGASRTCIRRC